ncbi:hypothetical protein [Denitratisoma oestradiolicum]|uniref:Uncharacterized protein n=1 Tax=Denitratisoma oestradiolicum TaxID=311182 RepID=A0A6S6XZ85_9PROT|nr:hypothetical protein [Denitratisoma oestradiolicum]TWO79297.1 hypothetical protein CBW56_15415 [Denitratisoma oestradiolicum]CAB1370378.1 conserved protein of unknown function [Denitratisoma oestradiolicum]
MDFLKQVRHWLEPEPPLAEGLAGAVDHAVETAAPLLKVLSDYQHKLAPAVDRARDYCVRLVDAIPGPRDIGHHSFTTDSLIHCFFGSSDEILVTLGRSEDVRRHLEATPGPDDQVCYGLLGMRAHEKSVLGSAMMGDVLRQEVPQTLLYFSDHTVSSLEADLETVRMRLRQAAFDSLLHQYAERLASLRRQREELAGELRLRRGSEEARVVEQNLEKLVLQLTPERQLQALAEWLATPESALYLKQIPRTVDPMGVLCPTDAAPTNAERIVFPELVGRDRRRWTVLLVSITRGEVREAVAREERAHRYIVI